MRDQVRQFWSETDLEKAKEMIHPIHDSPSALAALMPHLMTDKVMGLLQGKTAKAIEIGAGIGRVVKAMSYLFGAVLGVDISPTMVEFSKEYLKLVPNGDVVLTDGGTLPNVDNDSVDYVFSTICFQHIPNVEDIRSYIAEAYRVLKPGGLIRVQTLCGEPTKSFNGMYGHFYRSLEEFVKEFTDKGFTIVEATRGDMHEDYFWVTGQKG